MELRFIAFCAWLWFVDWFLRLVKAKEPLILVVQVIALVLGLLVLFGLVNW